MWIEARIWVDACCWEAGKGHELEGRTVEMNYTHGEDHNDEAERNREPLLLFCGNNISFVPTVTGWRVCEVKMKSNNNDECFICSLLQFSLLFFLKQMDSFKWVHHEIIISDCTRWDISMAKGNHHMNCSTLSIAKLSSTEGMGPQWTFPFKNRTL